MWLAISPPRVRMGALMSNKERQMNPQVEITPEQEKELDLAAAARLLWMTQEDFDEYMEWQREVEALRSDAARGYA